MAVTGTTRTKKNMEILYVHTLKDLSCHCTEQVVKAPKIEFKISII